MDDILRILKFFILSTITFLIIEFIVMPNDFGTGIIMVLTVLVLSPINTVICEVIYFTNINRHILSKFWMPVFESCTYLSLLFLIYKVKFPLLEQYGLYDFIAKLLLPYVIIIPLLLIHKLICKWLIKFKFKSK